MKLTNFKFSVKLAAIFSLLLLFTLTVGLSALVLLSRVNDATTDIATNWLPSIKVLGDMRGAANEFRRMEADHVMSVDPKEMEKLEALLKTAKDKLAKATAIYEPMLTPGVETRAYEEYKKRREAYFAVHDRLLPLSRGGASTIEPTQALFRGESSEKFEALISSLVELIEINTKGSSTSYGNATNNYHLAIQTVVVLLLVSSALSVFLAIWMTRQITRPLAQAVETLKRVAAGDLTSASTVEGRDETSELLNTMADMQDKLGAVVTNVRRSAEEVSTASSEIAQGNSDLSARTESQASSLEETAASMEELGVAVKHNADNAVQANQLAQSAAQVARHGGEVVTEVVNTMQEINQSSQRIAEIIGVIDGIAFQTNILALNAAVEAARAGEQGRGFAVVASEVRALASRSAEAAKEIKELINASVERVERGTTQVDQAGKTMQEIVTGVRRVVDLMSEISSASAEQSAGVAQVGETVGHMDQTTQQNAALVEEMAAAAASLRSQAQELVTTVSIFKLQQGAQDGWQAAGSPALLGAR